MLVVSSEDNALAWKLASGVTQPVVHQVPKDRAVGVFVVDNLVDLF